MLHPEDIDFPVSDTFARGLNELHGWGQDQNQNYEDPEPDWWIKLQSRWAKEEEGEEVSEEPGKKEHRSHAELWREIRTLKSENQYILRKLFELSNKKHKNSDCF